MLNWKQQRLLAEMNVNHSVLRPIVILNFLVCYFIYNSAIILLTFCLDERPSNGVSWRLNDYGYYSVLADCSIKTLFILLLYNQMIELN